VGERILALVGPPTARDRLEYEGHVTAGERMVRGVAGVSEAAEIVGAHEERFDGTGYPAALAGAEIPPEARIVSGAVAWAKLSRLLAGQDLAGALEGQSGNALDPEVVAAVLALLASERLHPSRLLPDLRTA
jgi:response regulator RpfG family c-di-GMP phosphodiesterase